MSADITNIYTAGGHWLAGQIVGVMCPDGFQIFWTSGGRSGVHRSWAQARDAASVAVPHAEFKNVFVKPRRWS